MNTTLIVIDNLKAAKLGCYGYCRVTSVMSRLVLALGL